MLSSTMLFSRKDQTGIAITLYCVIVKWYMDKYMYIFGCLILDLEIVAKTQFKRLSINIFTEQNIYESNSSVTDNFNSKTINKNSHIVILVILTPRNCKSCVFI